MKRFLFLGVLLIFCLDFFLEGTEEAFADGRGSDLPRSGNKYLLADSLSSSPQEVYLTFRYGSVVNALVAGLYSRDSIYLPFDALFTELKINHVVMVDSGVITGFYLNQDTLYRVNFRELYGTVGKKFYSFLRKDYIATSLDFYVLPSLLEALFGLHFSVDMSRLELYLKTEHTLPVVAEHTREVLRGLAERPYRYLVQAPLLYPRERSILNGGVFDYSLSTFLNQRHIAHSYAVHGGAEVLGGDFQGSIYGSVAPRALPTVDGRWRWRYVFEGTRFITAGLAGDIVSDGLLQRDFLGVQISNEPVQIRTFLGSYTIERKTHPNWEVDLYLNGQLVGSTKADALGFYRFEIPLVYGSSVIQLKQYGPSGEYEEQSERIQIPFTLIPAGEVDYVFSGGRTLIGNQWLAQGSVLAGLTNWLTEKIGVDYLRDTLYNKPVLYNSLSMRLFTNYLLNFDVSPSLLYRATFNAFYPSQASVALRYSHHLGNPIYNPMNLRQEMGAEVYLPAHLGNYFFGGVRTIGTVQKFATGLQNYSYGIDANISLPSFYAFLGYRNYATGFSSSRLVTSSAVSMGLIYTVAARGSLSILNGLLLAVNSNYNPDRSLFNDLSVQISKNFLQFGRFQIGMTKNLMTNSTSYFLQFIFDFPFTRSTTIYQSVGAHSFSTEIIQGSVAFDSHYKSFEFSNREWVGHSGASVRLFVDYNGNRRYDPGEEVIRGGSINLRQAILVTRDGTGIFRAMQLLPYTQYSVDIDENSIPNPLWIPDQKSFSFITDPNTLKPIDVPFFVSGIVAGSVMRQVDSTKLPVQGVRVWIRKLDGSYEKAIPVFYDGSFYQMGVPPGDYEAFVDSSQLASLHVYSNPTKRVFTVRMTKDGDYVEGLDFVLLKKD